MIKVVHVIPDLPPCGAEMVVITYLRKFKEDQKYQVTAISLSGNQHRLYETNAEKEGLNIKYLDQEIHNKGLIARIKQIVQIHMALKAEKPDIIHIHLSILWMVCLASWGLGVKGRFHTLHSDPEKTSYGIHIWIDRLCYSVFKVRPLCLNHEMADKANRLFHRHDVLVLTNGIELNKYQRNKRNEYRELFGFMDSDFVLGHVGRFNKVKNHKKILTVFQCLKRVRPQSKLLLVGEGELQEEVYRQAAHMGLIKDVVFTGARSDVPEMMGMMDCFIFPSTFEGLGIVLIEAQASGLHCVISNTIPAEAIVTQNVARLALDDSDEIWVQAILNEQTFLQSHHLTLNDYDINHIIDVLKEYYAAVL